MKKSHQIIALSGILLVVIHFTLILSYCFREDLPIALVQKADRYTVPLFHQNWKLFAPDLPKYNVELEYRIGGSSGWNNWSDASSSFGFGPTSKIETIEQGFLSGLGWQVVNNFYAKDGRAQYDRIVTSTSYASALYFVMKLHETMHPEIPIDSVQVRMNFRFTPEMKKGYTFQSSYLEFPVYIPIE